MQTGKSGKHTIFSKNLNNNRENLSRDFLKILSGFFQALGLYTQPSKAQAERKALCLYARTHARTHARILLYSFIFIKDVRGWQFLTVKVSETLCIVCLPPEEHIS